MMLLERTREFGGLAIGVPRVERRDVRRREIGRLREFRIEPVDERLAIAVEHPEREPQRLHILAAQRLLVTESEGFHRVHRQLADVELQKLPFGETTVVERVRVIFRLDRKSKRLNSSPY